MSTPPPLPADNPYAAPLARVDDVMPAELTLADRGTRLGAAILDGLASLIFVLPALVLIPMMENNGGQEPNPVLVGTMVVLMVGGLIALLVVNLMWLHKYGQTIGKRILKIKVLRADGSRCALSRIVFARWLPVTLLGQVPLIGPIAGLVDALMIFREDRRCLHDLIADTIVVRA
jgi:uncharacterized RDD family membrane protein YckC